MGWNLPEAADPPSTADRALARALRAWGGDELDRTAARFAPAWRERLAPARLAAGKLTPEAAWDGLRRDHDSSSRPDPTRVHPSWFVRALRGESPAVRRAVAAHARGPLREALRLGPDAPTPGPPADPEAVRWALALWSERLVGDVTDRLDDPPVIVALTHLSPRDLTRLARVTGLAKHAFAIEGPGVALDDESWVRTTSADRVRLGYFRRHIGRADPRLARLARLDLQVIGDDRRRGHSRVGLLTFGRLLAAAEPHRARWAIQHLPYPIAKLMRVKDAPDLPARALVAWEDWVLEAAWARLLTEGRLAGGRREAAP